MQCARKGQTRSSRSVVVGASRSSVPSSKQVGQLHLSANKLGWEGRCVRARRALDARWERRGEACRVLVRRMPSRVKPAKRLRSGDDRVALGEAVWQGAGLRATDDAKKATNNDKTVYVSKRERQTLKIKR